MGEAPTTSTDSTDSFALGIDVGKSALELALSSGEKPIAKRSVSNDSDGHKRLLGWLQDHEANSANTLVCMEASGGFEKDVARILHEAGYRVSIVNPRRISGYADSQLQRTKTDPADAALIARFGKREKPRPWEPSAEAQARLQELTRAKQALQKEKTRTQNRLNEASDEAVRRTYEDLLEQISEKIDALEEEIEEQVEKNQKLYDRCRLLETIPGVGLQTAAVVISELGPVDRFESARQAAAYAGLVPSHRESGTSVRGRPRMSKLGNARLRRGLYFPAMSALQCNPAIKAFGNRLKERGKEKMVVLGAAMRKLLHICYGVIKSGRAFDASLHPGT